MPPLPPVTKVLLLANVAAFSIDMLLGLMLTRVFALWPVLSDFFMPWQVVTYAFLHGGIGHLFFNMLGLWMFGSELERLWGQRRYLQFLLASVLAAAVLQLVVTYLAGARYPTVGASGGLFGLLLAFGMLFPNRIIVPLFPPIPMKAKYFVALFGALELVFGMSGTASGIAHFAHLGGMLGGFLMIQYWRGKPPFRGRRRF
ncbi:rhomboid family intramembrane serine protease [Caldimonas sp.]|uniref:rhomboid family intramembrane serine protease n=1 Tax=Caldimonas sp. TaxID=2838790 RepID=UPI0039194897